MFCYFRYERKIRDWTVVGELIFELDSIIVAVVYEHPLINSATATHSHMFSREPDNHSSACH